MVGGAGVLLSLFAMFGVIVAVALVAVVVAALIFNGLVSQRNRVQNGWAQIDVQLKRRHDLVPNLINAVKGFRGHTPSSRYPGLGQTPSRPATMWPRGRRPSRR